MSFVSSKDLDRQKEKRREARREHLETERRIYTERQKAIQRHKDLGHDKWLLPNIEKRVQEDSANYNSLPKVKKHKKRKKKKKKKHSSSSDQSESDEEWQEMTPVSKQDDQKNHSENWLTFDAVLGDDRTFSSTTLKERKETERQEKLKKDDEIGQHARELNPYWKDGGSGLPEQQTSSGIKKNTIHKDWLLRSLKRMNEQAKEQNKSIESIAAERYGSWAEFQRMLQDADAHRSTSEYSTSKKSFARPGDDDDLVSSNRKNTSFKRPRDDDEERKRHRFHKRNRYHRSDKPSWRKSSDEGKSQESEKDLFSKGNSNKETSRDQKKSSENVRSSQPIVSTERSRPIQNEDRTPSTKEIDTVESIPLENTSAPNTNMTAKEKNEIAAKILKAEMFGNSSLVEKLKCKSKVEGSTIVKTGDIQSTSKVSQGSEPAKILTDKEKNQLSAKILKAELMGNQTLMEKLKAKLDAARQAESAVKLQQIIKPVQPKQQQSSANISNSEEDSSEEETVILTRTGKDGQSWPLQQSELSYGELSNKRLKKTKVPTHKDGQRERYFGDDDRYSLDDLVRREKTEEAEDQHAMFSRLASKQFKGADSEYFTLDDMFVSQASRKNTATEEESRHRQKAISDHKKLARRLESCQFCFGNKELPKHLLIAIGKKCYLMLPNHAPLSEGHCFIVPMHHCNAGTSLDEDVWYEMKQFMRSLISMFKSKNSDCVFMQTCISLKKSRHFFIDCVPLPEEEGHLAPIYFKKAIQESESEWSHNKKLVDTRGKEVQKCIPKGLPYFSVDFGLDGGFAHVVEDEALFPTYFGREIIGGMLDVEPRLWRRPHKEHFTEQTKRSVKFSDWWKPYDWTSNITGP